MGGCGASSGVSKKGKKYGTEYRTILQDGNIKFVKYNESKQATAPMDTMTKNRIYVTVNNKNELKSITFYDENNKREKQIDLRGRSHTINGKKRYVHVHQGYYHDENGTRTVTSEEWALIRRVKHIWYNKKE